MGNRTSNIQELADMIIEMDNTISKGKAIEIAVQIERNEFQNAWLEEISQVLNRIEASIDEVNSK